LHLSTVTGCIIVLLIVVQQAIQASFLNPESARFLILTCSTRVCNNSPSISIVYLKAEVGCILLGIVTFSVERGGLGGSGCGGSSSGSVGGVGLQETSRP
jgi:hypothetical protein